jgi:preprotein translocase subunit SecE
MKWLTYFFKQFIPEVVSEMKKVTFPGREEVMGTTVVVVVTSFIFAFYLWAADLLIMRLYEGVFKLTSRLLG